MNFNNSHKWIKCSLFVYEAGALALSHIEQQSRSMKWTMQRKVNLQFTLKYWIHLLSNGVLIRTPGLFQLTRYHLKVFSEELQQYSNYLKYLKRRAVYVSVCPNHNKCLQTCSWSTTRPKIHYSWKANTHQFVRIQYSSCEALYYVVEMPAWVEKNLLPKLFPATYSVQRSMQQV